MSNEIWHSRDEAKSLYALIWRKTDDKVYDAVAAADTFDTYTDADIDDYDVQITNHADSDYHSADFPSDISAGVYRVQIMDEATPGARHADNDKAVGQGEIYWDGSAEIDLYTLDTSVNDDIIGEDGDTLESLSDQLDVLSSQSSRVLNVYNERE